MFLKYTVFEHMDPKAWTVRVLVIVCSLCCLQISLSYSCLSSFKIP